MATDQHQSVHGHDVIHLIRDASPAFTRAALQAEVEHRFGPSARFHTCSAQGMTLDGLLTFLLERGKVVERDGHLQPDLSKVCSHGDHDHDHAHR